MLKSNANILVLDDDPTVLASAKLFLKQKFSLVMTLSSPENLEKLLKEVPMDLVLLDMNYTRGESEGQEGLAIIERIVKASPDTEIIPITAYGEINLAVDAMKRGARDFVTKPWRNEKLLATIQNALNLRRASKEIEELRASNTQLSKAMEPGELPIVGESRPLLQLLNTVEKVAPTDANVLIVGENGTGKELIARLIHQKSIRKNRPFIKVDLGALAASLFESELFGHVKGAFTDAKESKDGKMVLANEGTLFLDEIGNIEVGQQAKLLTALQERQITPVGSNNATPVDMRLVSATNADLEKMAQEGSFRQDLRFRVNTIELHVPSLRQRPDDISLLTQYYLDLFKRKYQKPELKLSRAAMKVLQDYHWPGNIREFSQVLERAVILAEGPSLSPGSFHLSNQRNTDTLENLNLVEMEKSLILKSLEKNRGNITHAARDLGIDRLALYRRLEKYGL